MATSPKTRKDDLTNTIRNSMYRSGVVGTALKERYSKISEEDIIEAVDSQTAIINENNVTLSSIDTIARRISNNVFALAKLMQRLYEMKVKEKLLRDREKSRQEALQEELRFEPEKETSLYDREPRRVRKKEKSIFASDVIQLLSISSVIALGFKESINEFLKKAEKWFDDSLEGTQSAIEKTVEEADGLIANLSNDYVAEFDQEVKESKEEDLDTDRILNGIVQELENEDKQIDSALGIEDIEQVERDISDVVSRETISPDALQPTPERTYSEPISSEPIVKTVDQTQPTPQVAPPKLEQPSVLDFIEPADSSPTINPPPVASQTQGLIPATATTATPTSYGGGSSAIQSTMEQRNRTLNIERPSLFSRSLEKDLMSPIPQGSTLQSSFDTPFASALPSDIQPRSFSTPAMSFSPENVQNQNMSPVGSMIGQTSFNNRMMKTFPQQSNNNTTMISTGNLDAMKPAQDHFVLSPIANRGSLEIGVRFNADN